MSLAQNLNIVRSRSCDISLSSSQLTEYESAIYNQFPSRQQQQQPRHGAGGTCAVAGAGGGGAVAVVVFHFSGGKVKYGAGGESAVAVAESSAVFHFFKRKSEIWQ